MFLAEKICFDIALFAYFVVLLSKAIRDFLGLFVDMSYSGLETLNYLEELTHAVLDQNKDQIEVK